MPDQDTADQALRPTPAPDEARRAREAAALRANLARRKQQARARAADAPGGSTPGNKAPEVDAPCQ